MLTKVTASNSTTNTQVTKRYKPNYIFVLHLVDGRFVVGQSDKPAKRIATINSGMNPAIPKSLQIFKIVGIKPQEGERTFASVVKQFCEEYSEDNVIAV